LEEKNKRDELAIKKSHLRNLAKDGKEQAVLAIAQGLHHKDTSQFSAADQREIQNLFKACLGVEDLSKIDMTEMLHVLQPDTLLERFAARSAGAMGKHKDFLALKGTQGQIEGQTAAKLENVNELVGFKCLHYSVTESNGFVEITINKKNTSQEISFGCRTIDGTALENKDYEKFN